MASYLKEHAIGSPSKEWIGYTAEPILIWWADKTLADVSGKNCRDYVMWRTAQRHRHGKHPKPISEQTARHELKTLRTAINWYHGEHGPLAGHEPRDAMGRLWPPPSRLPEGSSQRH